MNPVIRFIYWNMNYHVEHHMFPMVPYHNLPKLHELMKADMPPPYNGLAEAYREIIPTLVRESKDPGLLRPAPAADAAPRAETARTCPRDHLRCQRRTPTGWVEVCDLDLLAAGRRAALRARGQDLRHLPHSRSDSCSPPMASAPTASAPLADGFLQGTVHRVPQAQRPLRRSRRLGAAPAPRQPCEAYEARERDGKVLLNVASSASDAAGTAQRQLREQGRLGRFFA